MYIYKTGKRNMLTFKSKYKTVKGTCKDVYGLGLGGGGGDIIKMFVYISDFAFVK